MAAAAPPPTPPVSLAPDPPQAPAPVVVTPSNPFGVPAGSSVRPGVITPAPAVIWNATGTPMMGVLLIPTTRITIGGTDIRSAQLPPPGTYGGDILFWANAFDFVDGNGDTVPALANGYLEKADNGALLSDVISASGAGTTVTFDEYHHGLTVSDFAPQSWLTTAWGAAVLWLLVAVFFGRVLRGRRFGPLVGPPAELARSDAEWSGAVGQLLRRSSARTVTLGLLATATERAVAAQTGLPLQPRERFWNALWVRAPEVARELAEIESSLHAASASERQLLSAARRLHEIAHPLPSASPR